MRSRVSGGSSGWLLGLIYKCEGQVRELPVLCLSLDTCKGSIGMEQRSVGISMYMICVLLMRLLSSTLKNITVIL